MRIHPRLRACSMLRALFHRMPYPLQFLGADLLRVLNGPLRTLGMFAFMLAGQACVHSQWAQQPKLSVTPSRIAPNEEALFEDGLESPSDGVCEKRIVHVDFAPTCVRCAKIELVVDGNAIARAYLSTSPPSAIDEWLRPPVPRREKDALAPIVFPVDGRSKHKLSIESACAASISGSEIIDSARQETSCSPHVEIACGT